VSWPGGARAALSLSFDNLGEAAEIELGAPGADAPLGEHFTATRVLPALLDTLRKRDLAATFFVEGLNTELHPDSLRAIAADGHELGYHAWRHEQWGDLPAAEQAENLARGLAAFAELGLEIVGIRPPGGQLGSGGIEVVCEAGLSYCSPAGEGAGTEDGLALLPFQWRHVDATCLLPPLAPVRQKMTGFIAIVLHLTMLDWLGEDRLGTLLDLLVASSRSGDLWLAPCAEVAEHVLASSGAFMGRTTLDPTSWA
jgi:peptidoglycan/xylan/chitin deacetylase (PgdA/CDA1 family)